MTSKLSRGYDFSRGETIFEIRISDLDLIEVHLNRADRRIIYENNENLSKTPVADILLELELIVRRIEEGKNNDTKKL